MHQSIKFKLSSICSGHKISLEDELFIRSTNDRNIDGPEFVKLFKIYESILDINEDDALWILTLNNGFYK